MLFPNHFKFLKKYFMQQKTLVTLCEKCLLISYTYYIQNVPIIHQEYFSTRLSKISTSI